MILQRLRAVSLQHTNIIHLVATGTSEAHGHGALQDQKPQTSGTEVAEAPPVFIFSVLHRV